MKYRISLALVCLILIAHAGTPAGWSVSPFEQKVFIQNNGQFIPKAEGITSPVLFGASTGGVELYFTNSGLIYEHNEWLRDKEREEEENNAEENEDPDRKNMKLVTTSLAMQWIGSNPLCTIVGEKSVETYFTYGTVPGATIRAGAFRIIKYINLYNNIDVEYYLPEDKQGIKYSIIVKPGGDPSQIKMRFSGEQSLALNSGDLVIQSMFGDVIDHKPFTYCEPLRNEVTSAFVVADNEVTFDLGSYDHSSTLIIDPCSIA